MCLRWMVLFTALVVGVATMAAEANQPPDISGTWIFSVDVGGTHGAPTFVFTQDGQKLAGTVTNGSATQKIAGTVKGNKAVFGFQGLRDGRMLKATYEGSLVSATKMTGRVEFSGALNGTGTWTATKK